MIKILNLKLNSRSQAEVVTTVLLILISIAAIVIVMSYILPFIKNKSSESNCFDFAGKIEIVNSEFTCYDASAKKMLVQIGVKDIDAKKESLVTSLKIMVGEEGGSEIFEITNSGGNPAGKISTYNGSAIKIPKNGQEKTYNLTVSKKPISIDIYPILETKYVCNEIGSKISAINSCD
ncbi:MAG: hypothetical protein AABX54_00115 [Nanoarchaeota archaeon]